jgi:hypothetical protein
MKLGISYNVFDGEELLEGSIKQIRESVDYISVVYQTISNFGSSCNSELLSILEKLKVKKLVDEIILYSPTFLSPHIDETKKRQIGLEYSIKNGCSHHMSMDTDEYYEENNFKNLKKIIIDGDYDSSYCQMLTYYKTWEYVLEPPEDYYVPLIYKINKNTHFKYGGLSPVLVDPTRKISNLNNPIVLKREQIQMHHGSYIRKDMRKKLENSTANVNFKNDIDKIVEHYNNWEYPQKVLWAGQPSRLLNIKKVNNLFI